MNASKIRQAVQSTGNLCSFSPKTCASGRPDRDFTVYSLSNDFDPAWGEKVITKALKMLARWKTEPPDHVDGRSRLLAVYPGEVYVCSTRRRKPGVCNNTLALPIDATDDAILDIVEGEVLGTRFIEELLALVDRGEEDNSALLVEERNRVQAEIANLVNSIAVGVPADTVAPAIKERETEIARLDVQLRRPRREQPDRSDSERRSSNGPSSGKRICAKNRESRGWSCAAWSVR